MSNQQFGLAELVDSFMTDTVTVRRPIPGSYDAVGRWVDAGYDEIEMDVAVFDGLSEIVRETEGTRDRGTKVLFAKEPLYEGSIPGGQTSDMVLLDGFEWTVERVSNWQGLYECHIRRRTPTQ